MELRYDKQADAAYIKISHYPIKKSVSSEDQNFIKKCPFTIIDYDSQGYLRGIEILDASKHIPRDYLYDRMSSFKNCLVTMHPIISEFIAKLNLKEPPEFYQTNDYDWHFNNSDEHGNWQWCVNFDGIRRVNIHLSDDEYNGPMIELRLPAEPPEELLNFVRKHDVPLSD